LVRNGLFTDDSLGAHDALGERCRRNEKCPGNLLGGQAADFAQGKGNLSFGRQSGMAAGEDQAEAIIFDLLVIDLFVMQGSFVDARFHIERKIFLRLAVEARAPAHSIDRLEACR
jgi:hypothetical protein